jgi:sugar/nucleoside kinase (ribokinase family)
MDIISSGLICADVVVKPVKSLPRLGTAQAVDSVELRCGGCGLNTAIVLHRLGVSVGIAGKVGLDAFGDFLVKEVAGHGIDVRGVVRDADVHTTSAVAMVSPSGERSFLYSPGSSSEKWSPQDVDSSLLASAKILHVGGIMKLRNTQSGTLLKRAKEMGLITSLDTDWDASGKWLELVEACLPHTDLFLPNLDEAAFISGKKAPNEMAEFFFARGVQTFALKMGEKGCYVRTVNDEFVAPGYKVDVVDTTGAGDAFVGGFLAGYHKGWDLKKCAQLANACGALCTTKIGATDGVRDLEGTIAFMRAASHMAEVEGARFQQVQFREKQ